MRVRLFLALPLLLAACGDLRPLAGKPGATGQVLVQPPPSRLAVPVPGNALLPDTAAAAYAHAITATLLVREVPAETGPAQPGDWRLDIAADLRGQQVVPRFTVLNPAGKPQGSTEGPPADAARWADGNADELKQEADGSGPVIADLLTRIEAIRRRSDPNSLLNRPPKLLVADVVGAPGDGNRILTRDMRHILPQLGEIVQDQPAGADFTVAGHVKVVPGMPTDRVEIRWIVTDSQSREVGQVVQLNDVARGTLDGLWGDVALVVAQEAASGVRSVIEKQTGRTAPATAPQTAPTTPPKTTPAATPPATPPPP